jgi:hypothetical protein
MIDTAPAIPKAAHSSRTRNGMGKTLAKAESTSWTSNSPAAAMANMAPRIADNNEIARIISTLQSSCETGDRF